MSLCRHCCFGSRYNRRSIRRKSRSRAVAAAHRPAVPSLRGDQRQSPTPAENANAIMLTEQKSFFTEAHS